MPVCFATSTPLLIDSIKARVRAARVVKAEKETTGKAAAAS